MVNKFGQQIRTKGEFFSDSDFGQRACEARMAPRFRTTISDNIARVVSPSEIGQGRRTRRLKTNKKITKNKFGRITFRTIGFFSTDNCTANFQGPILPWNVRFPLADVQARPPLPARSARSAIAGHGWPAMASHGQPWWAMAGHC